VQCELLGCADTFGNSRIPLYVLNATYPLVPAEWVKFCSGKRAVLVVEEGQPEFIEQAATQILHQHELNTRIVGKEMLPQFGEYSVDALRKGLAAFIDKWAPLLSAGGTGPAAARKPAVSAEAAAKLAALVPPRPSGCARAAPSARSSRP